MVGDDTLVVAKLYQLSDFPACAGTAGVTRKVRWFNIKRKGGRKREGVGQWYDFVIFLIYF